MYLRRCVLAYLLVLSASLCLLTVVSQPQVWYVKPSPGDSCPINYTSRCAVLGDYITEYGWLLWGVSNITFHFLPGRHVLDTGSFAVIAYGSNITLTGSERHVATSFLADTHNWEYLKTTVYCANNSGLYFSDITSLSVTNLSFIGCGAHLFDAGRIGLVFNSINHLMISGVVVSNCKTPGFGAWILSSRGVSHVSHSIFVNNGNGNNSGSLLIALVFRERPECLRVSESEVSVLTIHASQFLDSDGYGIQLRLNHFCIEINITLQFVQIANNNYNLHVDVNENQPQTAGHRITVQNCQILNGYSSDTGTEKEPGFYFKSHLWPNEPSSGMCTTSQQRPPTTSLVLLNTVISGNIGHGQGSTGGLLILFQATCQSTYIILDNVTLSNNTADSEWTGFAGNMFLNLNTLTSVYDIWHTTVIRHSSFKSGIGRRGGLGILGGSRSHEKQLFSIEIYNTSFIDNKGSSVGGAEILPFTTSLPPYSGIPYDQLPVQLMVHFNHCVFSRNAGSQVAALRVHGYTIQSMASQFLKKELPHIVVVVANSVFQSNSLLPLVSGDSVKFDYQILIDLQYSVSFSLFAQEYIMSTSTRLQIPRGTVITTGIQFLTFHNTHFTKNKCVALKLGRASQSPRVYFKGHVVFSGNRGTLGGAISLPYGTFILIEPNTKVYFINNSAEKYGGAIYMDTVLDEVYYLPCKIFPTLPSDLPLEEAGVQVYFINNTAGIAGDALYGGYLDICDFLFTLVTISQTGRDIPIWDYPTSLIYNLILDYSSQQGLSVVSSDPIGACFCNAGLPDCSNKLKDIEVFPGETKNVSMVAVGQRNGVVPTTVYVEFEDGSKPYHFLGVLQEAQPTDKTCTNLTVTVHSSKTLERVKFTIINPTLPQTALDDIFIVPVLSVNLLFCPLGFILTPVHPVHCDCVPRLHKEGITCNINDQTVHRPQQFWIGYDVREGINSGVLIHPHCPFAYCHQKEMDIQLAHVDDQCDLRHSGILCGGCREGLSLALGSSRCLQCSNSYLGLIAAFATAGLVLVAFLTLCDLTISEGTLNAIIFYANIVQIRSPLFLPANISMYPLTLFIAWMNLDLGIETCFFDGMDMYVKAWLQFIFPFYIWIIVLLMVVSSHYYTTAARIVGRNAPKVLATLFLLSYAKLLRALITIFSFTYLEYPDGSTKALWLYDGNVFYLRGKHVPLFMAAILTALFLLLPYTVVVLFHQCLQRRSGDRVFTWVRRLKPILDAYGGPYKDRHRYWPGLLLLCRVILFLSFAINSLGDPKLDSLLIIVGTVFLFCWMQLQGGLYKNRLVNALEAFILATLGITSAATSYVFSSGGSQKAVGGVFIGTVFATFIVVVIYHMYSHVRKWRLCERRLVHYEAVRMSELQESSGSDSSDSESVDNQVVGVQLVTIDRNCTS